nr:flagellar biosynthetic protein FliO [Anaeromyxobacter sp. SG22]
MPVAGAALAATALAFAPGGLGPVAARAGLVAAALWAAAVLARRRAAPAPAPALAIVSRASLARDAGGALVEVDGRRLVVGYGSAGVQLLAATSASSAEGSAP